MKKFTALFLAALLLLTLSACSAGGNSETLLQKIASDISDLVPNDLEYLLDSAMHSDSAKNAHDSILSTGYANMMKNGKYYLQYSLSAGGGTLECGISGLRAGYRSGSEHVVIDADEYYLLDDVNLTATHVDASAYSGLPIAADASDIKFDSAAEESFDGKPLVREDYSAGGGSIRFWLDGSNLYAVVIDQPACKGTFYITEFSKRVTSELVNVPANYAVY